MMLIAMVALTMTDLETVAVAMVEAPIPMVMEYQTPTMLAQMKPPMLKMMLIATVALTTTDLEPVMEAVTAVEPAVLADLTVFQT